MVMAEEAVVIALMRCYVLVNYRKIYLWFQIAYTTGSVVYSSVQVRRSIDLISSTL